MADISKITIGGVTYNIKDATARGTLGALHFLGIGSALTNATPADGGAQPVYVITDTTNKKAVCYYITAPSSWPTTVTINSVAYTLADPDTTPDDSTTGHAGYVLAKAGDVVIVGDNEYILGTDSKWHFIGTAELETITVAANTHTHSTPKLTHTVSSLGTSSFSVDYTPAGTVSSHTHTVGSSTTNLGISSDASKVTPGTAKNVASAGTAVTVSTGHTINTTATNGDAIITGLNTTSLKGVSGTNTVHDTPTLNTSKLDLVSIRGVNATGTTASKVTLSLKTASKATAGTAVDVAKAGTAVKYGTANVGTAVTGLAKITAFNGGSAATLVSHAPANKATSDIVIASVTGEVLSLNSLAFGGGSAASMTYTSNTSVTPAVAAPDTQTIIPAVSNGTVTPYTFSDVACTYTTASDVTVPVANTTATDVAAGTISDTGTGADVGISLTAGSEKTFATANTSATTVVTGGTTKYIHKNTTSVTPAVANGTITPVTVDDATISITTGNTTGTTVVTGVTTPTGATQPTFTGTAATISGTGTNSGITIADHAAGTTGNNSASTTVAKFKS